MHKTSIRRSATWTFGLFAALAVVVSYVSAPPTLAADAPKADHLTISKIYASGGSKGASYKNKFVELYNPTEKEISLEGLSLQYFAAKNTKASGIAALTGKIAANKSFLIKLSSNNPGEGKEVIGDLEATNVNIGATDGSVALITGTEKATLNPDSTNPTVIDLVGYGNTKLKESASASQGDKGKRTFGWLRVNPATDSNNNSTDFSYQEVKPYNDTNGGTTPPNPNPQPTTDPQPPTNPTVDLDKVQPTAIKEVQGEGSESPKLDQDLAVSGVITATYPFGGFYGYYLQTPNTAAPDLKNLKASEAIFVHVAKGKGDVPKIADIGKCLKVYGKVTEYSGLTEIEQAQASAPSTENCGTVHPVEMPADPSQFPTSDESLEALEGMLISVANTPLTVTDNYSMNKYGEVGLALGDKPLVQNTDAVAPGTAATEFEAANAKKVVLLDDGRSTNLQKVQKAKLAYLTDTLTVRVGAKATFTKPVIMDYRFGWKLQPTAPVEGVENSPVDFAQNRPAAPQVGGDLKIGTFNVLNYFTDLGQDEKGCKAYKDKDGNGVTANRCQVRGAYTPAALADQQGKIVAAINGLGADVIGLEEIENSSNYGDRDRDRSLRTLVAALNAADSQAKWEFAPSPANVPNNGDAIRTAFIYKSDKVKLAGASEILDDPSFTGTARSPLAQKFTPVAKAGAKAQDFVVITNHFKSKGSVLDGDENQDKGDGQGANNGIRVKQAQALAGFAQKWNDIPVFLVGDFNSYAQEDPIKALEKAGFTRHAPGSADSPEYSYMYSGRVGSLDHLLANAKGSAILEGHHIWDINADEPIAKEYSRRNYNGADVFEPNTPYRSSDHDPMVAGIKVYTDDTPAPNPDPKPNPDPDPTPVPVPNPDPKPNPNPQPQPQPTDLPRLSGEDRVATSLAAWEDIQKTSNSPYMILAGYTGQPDALSAVSLAGSQHTSVVFTKGDSLDPRVRDALIKHQVKRVTVVGGPGTVSEQVLNELSKLGIKGERISGADRYETSALIAKAALTLPGQAARAELPVVLANGLNYADSLTAGALAHKLNAVLLLSKDGKLPAPTSEFLAHGFGKIYPVGGFAAQAARSHNLTAQAIGQAYVGKDRFHTAVLVSENFPAGSTMALTSGYSDADATVASAWVSNYNGGVLLTNKDSLPSVVKDRIASQKYRLVVIGGPSQVSYAVSKEAAALVH